MGVGGGGLSWNVSFAKGRAAGEELIWQESQLPPLLRIPRAAGEEIRPSKVYILLVRQEPPLPHQLPPGYSLEVGWAHP